ncbi:MAG: hypothetical protein ACLGSA_04005 [Acidobacteriota bacterium]
MKRIIAFVFALALTAGMSGLALAQAPAAAPAPVADEAAPAPTGEKGFKMLDANADGKVTKEEFLAAAQKRATARFDKLDTQNKGYLTKEDFMAARGKAREKAQARKAKAAPAPQQ